MDLSLGPGTRRDIQPAGEPRPTRRRRRDAFDDGESPPGDLLVEDDPVRAESTGHLLQYRRDTGQTRERGYWRATLDFAGRHLRGD